MKIRLRHEKLAAHLARSRMTQNRWAQKLGLHKGHLSRLTNGQRPYPGPETRRKLLEGLGLPFDALFVIEGAESPTRLHRLSSRLRRTIRAWTPGFTRGWSAELRQSVRALRRQPGYALLALSTVALGIGANTAIFTLVNGILLAPLPFPEPDRIVYLWSVRNQGTTLGRLSYQDYLSLAEGADSLESLAVVNEDDLTWVGDGGAERVPAEMVTAPFFSVLGIAPAAGRPLLRSETVVGSAGDVVVISHGFWQAKLGGVEGVIGSTLRLNGLPYQVVGVMPPGFGGLLGAAQLWVPLTQMDALHPDLQQYNLLDHRGTRFLVGIGRRAAGIENPAVQDQLSAVAEQLTLEFPRTNQDKGIRVEPLGEVVRGDFRTPVLWLMGAVGLVLLIAVANLAHLSLARSTQRIREVAIRTALGAPAPRMLRHLLTESLLLAAAGGLAGIVLAQLTLVRVLDLLPEGLPGYITPALDSRVMLFSIVLSLLVGVAFGLAPALLAVRRGAAEALKQNSTNLVGRGRRKLTTGLVVAEVALSLALLAGAGLMLQGLVAASSFDPGYDPSRLITASFDLPVYKFSGEEQGRVLQALLDRVGSLPGVESASLSSHLYYGDGYMTGDVRRADDPDNVEIRTQMMWVTPGFFRTLGVELQEGRDFADSDRDESPSVAVVSRGFAEEAWPGESPVGKVLRGGTSAESTISVVGVVGSVRTSRRAAVAPNQLYFAVNQGGLWSRALMIRTQQPAVVIPSLRAAIREVDAEIPIFQVRSMESLVEQTFAGTRLLALLTSLFAGAALLLATLGVYGVMAFTVAQARSEVGIRIALGASPSDVIRQYVTYGALRTVAGLVIGLALAVLLVQVIGTQLPDIEPFDPPVFAAVSLLLLGAALLASWVPAWRASRVDPLETVRAE